MEKWKIKLKALYEAYGPVAIGVAILVNLGVLIGAAVAIHFGWSPESMLGKSVGTGLGAYAVYKIVILPRWILIVVLTPIVAKLIGRKPKLPAS